VVIAEDRILLTVERGTAEVIINSHIASTIIVEVPRLVGREVSAAIERQVVASAKLVGVASAIDVEVPRPINREVSVAVDGNVTSRANVLIP